MSSAIAVTMAVVVGLVLFGVTVGYRSGRRGRSIPLLVVCRGHPVHRLDRRGGDTCIALGFPRRQAVDVA